MKSKPEMRRSWLVQRLKEPHGGGRMGALAESFAFGGGYRNGGLSDDAMTLLRGVFRFDYMGAAEFEWGAVPEALSGLAKDQKQLVAFSFTFPLREVAANWRTPKDAPEPDGDATVYVLCRKSQADEVQARVREWAAGKGRLMERTNLDSTLRPVSEWDGETVGWLELDNGFLFFTSEPMWTATASLLGVKIPARVSS